MASKASKGSTFLLATMSVASAHGAARVSPTPEIEAQFQAFESLFKKAYSTPEIRSYRMEVFAESLRVAALRTGAALHGVTKFSDLTEEEFSDKYLSGYQRRKPSHPTAALPVEEMGGAPVPIDWRTKGVVTPVKDQGHCGSCWAFSVVEQVESQALQQKLLPHGSTLSVQQMVDCDDFSHGCAGGSPETAYDYLTIGGGITTADKYGKYIGNATEKCHFSKASAVITAPAYPAYKSISRGKSGEAAMYAKIASTPMAICVQADLWKSYKGGIISSADGCGGQDPDALNHCVQVVGVGEDAETKSPYWIVRNSWGADFGNDGYVYLATGGNVCGIAMEASVAVGLAGV